MAEGDIITRLPNGMLMVKKTVTDTSPTSAGNNVTWTVTVDDLEHVEHVISHSIRTDPVVQVHGIETPSASGNVVGGTIANLAAGTTLQHTVVVVGL